MSRSPDPVRLQRWNDRIIRCQQSHLTVAEFCRRQAIPVSCFYQWKKKLASLPPQASLSTPQFLPLRISSASLATMPVVKLPVIKLPHGVSIDLPVDLHRRQLSELLAACIDASTSHQPQETLR